MLVFLYKMYVQPHLEYCVQVWNPYVAKDIDVIEKVPPIVIKAYLNCRMETGSKNLDLYSLYCRRQRGDLIEV